MEKRLDKKAKVNFKLYDVKDWETNNYNKHVAQYPKKKRQPENEIWSVNRISQSVLINQFIAPTFCVCFAFTGINFRGITFLTWPMRKTCVDQSELVNVGAQID